MVRAPQASDRSCCSVHHRLQTTELVRRDADQRDVEDPEVKQLEWLVVRTVVQIERVTKHDHVKSLDDD